MRRIRLAPLVALVACSSTAGPAGPQGPAGPAGAGADPSWLMSIMERLTAVEQRAAKVPWFVDGETREPIGRVLDYSAKVAWNDELGVPVPAYTFPLYFADADCKGEVRAQLGDVVLHGIAPDGRVLKRAAPASLFRIQSRSDRGFGCRSYPVDDTAAPFTDTGAQMHPALMLTVDFR